MERPPRASPSRWREALRHTLPLAALAGLIEGTAIARYDVLAARLETRDLAAGVGVMVAIVALHLLLWTAPAVALARWLRPQNVARVAVTIWALVAIAGRWMLADRSIGWSWWLPPVALVLLWTLGLLLDRASSVAVSRLPGALAVALIAVFSLCGRVPDYSHSDGAILVFLGGSALVAVAILVGGWKRPLWTAAVVAVAIALPALRSRPESPTDAPNVLFVLVDTVRRDHVEPFGDRSRTPAIERLADQGVTFLDAVTPVPKTPASVASFWTGDYPITHGVRALTDHLEPEQRTVVEAFLDAGYETTAFVNNAWLSEGRGFGQGFTRFYGYFEVNRPYGPFRYVSWVVLADRLLGRRIAPFHGQTSAAALTDSVLGYLDHRRAERPFFAYVHYFEPHWPYYPPAAAARRYGAPEDGRCAVNLIELTEWSRSQMIFENPLPELENEVARRLYRAEIDDTMAEVGRLIETIDARGLGNDTVIVFTADHGHALGEHDYYYHHGEFLYDDTLRIPLVLRWPGRLPSGRRVEAQVRSIDVAPTIAALANVDDFEPRDGTDLRPFWETDDEASRPALLESDVTMFGANRRRPIPGIPGKLRGARDGRHKLIVHPLPGGLSLELYDLVADPAELENLAAVPEMRPVVQGLLAAVMEQIPPAEWREMMAAVRATGPQEAPETELDDAETEMLRSLGYVQ